MTPLFKTSGSDTRPKVEVFIEGQKFLARQGDTVAAALLASGIDARRETAVSGAPRLPYCMMGVCFDCLVTIDGVGNRQGCIVTVEPGMQIHIQKGRRELDK